MPLCWQRPVQAPKLNWKCEADSSEVTVGIRINGVIPTDRHIAFVSGMTRPVVLLQQPSTAATSHLTDPASLQSLPAAEAVQ